MIPHQLVLRCGETFDLREIISRPYPEEDGEYVQTRSPGDPTTMTKDRTSSLVIIQAHCERDEHEWIPYVDGEYTNSHINCMKCGRGYYAKHTKEGKFLGFESDRKLTYVPMMLGSK